MPCFICTTCGVQFAESAEPPERCAICEDERQYVGWKGQGWTTLDELQKDHVNEFRDEEPGIVGIGTRPQFTIGQRALLVRTPGGNVLWDCISLIDDATVAAVQELGGLSAIAISHPHFYDSMVEWSRALGDVPIYLHAADRQWTMRPDPAIVYWEGATRELGDGLTLVHCGGHFEGSTVLHWAGGAEGRGALLTGDTLQVVPDRSHVAFMRSYPNYIPLGPEAVERIVKAIEPLEFDRLHGGWWDLAIRHGGKEAVGRSAERYFDSIG